MNSSSTHLFYSCLNRIIFKAEKSRAELQRELEELSDKLDEVGGASQAQHELNKKREAEMQKMKRDIDAMTVNHETQLSALRKKHNDAVTELGEQLDQMQKIRQKYVLYMLILLGDRSMLPKKKLENGLKPCA